MPVEMRELIIKTEIKTQSAEQSANFNPQTIKALKQEIIDECLRAFKDRNKRNSFNR
jgi:hypothetical protein